MFIFLNRLLTHHLSVKKYEFHRHLSAFATNRSQVHDQELSQEIGSLKLPEDLEQIENVSDFVRFDRRIEDANAEDFHDLIEKNHNDDHLKTKIRLICAEYNYIKRTSILIPSKINCEDMNELLMMNSIQRQRYLRFLCLRETFRMREKVRKRVKSRENGQNIKEKFIEMNSPRTGLWNYDGNLVYGLWHNTLGVRFDDQIVRKYCVHRLRNAALFGPKLGIDFQYEDCLSRVSMRKVISQIHFIYNQNRYVFNDPFDIHFFNLNPHSASYHFMNKYFVKLHSSDSFITMDTNSFIDVIPNDRIVYLTSYAEEPLQHFDHDCVYILGGIGDQSPNRLSSATIAAYDAGVKVKRLPIKEYSNLKSNTYMCLNHTVSILNDVKDGSDWNTAFVKHLPQRRMRSALYESALKRVIDKDTSK